MLPLPRYAGHDDAGLKSLQLVFSNGGAGVFYGYGLVHEQFRSSNSSILYFPFYVAPTTVCSNNFIQEMVRKHSIFPVDRKSFYNYNINLVRDADFSIPEKQACSLTDSAEMMNEILSLLSKNYPRIILCRKQLPTNAMDDNFFMSIYNCSDILPEEIDSKDSLWVKVYGEGREFIDLVFTKNTRMFDCDGFSIDSKMVYGPEMYLETTRNIVALNKIVTDTRKRKAELLRIAKETQEKAKTTNTSPTCVQSSGTTTITYTAATTTTTVLTNTI
jgi:hypothetical protein